MFNDIYLHTHIYRYIHIFKAAMRIQSNWKAFVQWTCSGSGEEFVRLNGPLNRYEDVWDFLIWGVLGEVNSARDACFWYDKSPYWCTCVTPS